MTTGACDPQKLDPSLILYPRRPPSHVPGANDYPSRLLRELTVASRCAQKAIVSRQTTSTGCSSALATGDVQIVDATAMLSESVTLVLLPYGSRAHPSGYKRSSSNVSSSSSLASASWISAAGRL